MNSPSKPTRLNEQDTPSMMISDDIKLWLGSDADSRNISNISGSGSGSRHMLVAYNGRLDRLFLELVEFSRVLEDSRENQCVLNVSIDNDNGSFISVCLLIGSYLILKEGKNYDAVTNLFRSESFVLDLSATPDTNAQISVSDCWRALDAAVKQGWFEPRPTGEEAALDLEELLHYAQNANGLVFMPIPGELYFFSTPDDSLKETADWADRIDDADGRIARSFSPGFTADLLSDLGATVAVCLDKNTSLATREALACRGIAAADLLLPADGSALLRGLDRLLLLLAAAPGAVAVHSGRGREWPRYAGALAQAVLMSRLGFDARAAEVWLRLTCSWMLCDDAHEACAQ
jgi:hypothetical protein